jgi:hypothetical protein
MILRGAAFGLVLAVLTCAWAEGHEYQLATFSAEVTIPIGHRCMGVLEIKAKKIADPLLARGFVITGPRPPIVLVSVDWCEIRNDAYQRWREVLAEAAGTVPERVLVSSVHQHDAPVVDLGAEALLAEVGLAGELCDVDFHALALARVARALRAGLDHRHRVTHIGLGQARVEQIASNRRVVHADGRVEFDRGSGSGGDAILGKAPTGLIDPWLKTISFWDGEKPLVALHAYATHPMSYYGRGEVSADFVGMARQRMQDKFPQVLQIYVSGCSGDVTAGKYNDGSTENRPRLAGRLYRAMESAWQQSQRQPLQQVEFRRTPLVLDFHDGGAFTTAALRKQLDDKRASVKSRILAAMGLASRNRLDRPIELSCIDFGLAQIVLFPAEAFVGYQLMAQQLRPDSWVLSIGYGECWPGYIPTRAAFVEHFGSSWRWVALGAEARIRAALQRVLTGPHISAEKDQP